jgi:hypothetical protein
VRLKTQYKAYRLQIDRLEDKKYKTELRRDALEITRKQQQMCVQEVFKGIVATEKLTFQASELHRVVKVYSKQVCAQWCQNFHFRLPYELRRMIYDRLPLQTMIMMSGKRFSTSTPPIRQRMEKHYRTASHCVLAKPYIGDVGPHIAREMVGSFVARSQFYIEGLAHPEFLLPRLFDADPFGLGVDLFAHIRRFRLAFDTNVIKDEAYEVHTDCLDLLKNFKYKDTVSIRIYRPNEEKPQRVLLRVLEALSGWLYATLDEGLKIDCGLKVGRTLLDLWRIFGTSMADFEEFKATWPKNVRLGLRCSRLVVLR